MNTPESVRFVARRISIVNMSFHPARAFSERLAVIFTTEPTEMLAWEEDGSRTSPRYARCANSFVQVGAEMKQRRFMDDAYIHDFLRKGQLTELAKVYRSRLEMVNNIPATPRALRRLLGLARSAAETSLPDSIYNILPSHGKFPRHLSPCIQKTFADRYQQEVRRASWTGVARTAGYAR